MSNCAQRCTQVDSRDPWEQNIYHSVGQPGAGLFSLMVKAWSGSATSKMPALPSAERLNQGFHHRMDPEGASTELLT